MAHFSRFSQFWTIFGGHTLIENQNLTLLPSDVGPKLSNPVRYVSPFNRKGISPIAGSFGAFFRQVGAILAKNGHFSGKTPPKKSENFCDHF